MKQENRETIAGVMAESLGRLLSIDMVLKDRMVLERSKTILRMDHACLRMIHTICGAILNEDRES